MKHPEIRRLFYDFFSRNGHEKVLSSPLVPAKDPTLLFTNAGMNQFKGVFLQKERRDYRRAVTIQKCMRVSGKHNDFDEVGKTDFHHTFFEMMGNFSFGDYFKELAATYAWELLTLHYGLHADRLWVTVFREDDDAAEIWEKKVGVPAARIVRRDEKDNFWQMGDTGPCGPCSEIHFDRGDPFGPADFTSDNSRYVEVWNLVFMQYHRDENGTMHPLPAPSIDTGMGLERLASILQNKSSNYQTDLFRPIIERIADMASDSPDRPDRRVDYHVIADHSRAMAFLISDGVLPANDGRGYVLRRILRRAIKHGKSLGMSEGFLGPVCEVVIDCMSPFYPELAHNREFIGKILLSEEERFNRTLSNGLKIFEEVMATTRDKGLTVIPGSDLFRLSDTFGFPLDFARDLAAEKGMQIGFPEFERELAVQRERSRAGTKGKHSATPQLEGSDQWQTEFCGYEELESETHILALTADDRLTEALRPGERGRMILAETPFYAESGGQAGDRGTGRGEQAFFSILNTRKAGAWIHDIQIESGTLRTGERVRVEVDRGHRQATSIHHSVTHLLHAALREVLGSHVKQSGSHVGPEKLRFDFTHYQPLSSEEIEQAEREVNDKIRENLPIASHDKRYEEAIALGAIAIFEEKYGDWVRMVSMGDYSLELCGGTHLDSTGQIGIFKILAETSIASGIRRIEAMAGQPAYQYLQVQSRTLFHILQHFNQSEKSILAHLQSMEKRLKENEREMKRKSAAPLVSSDILIREFRAIDTPPVIVAFVENIDPQNLGALADEIKEKIQGIAVLFTIHNDKTRLVASVHPNLTKRLPANIIIPKMAAPIKGKGGGRADFAQAGGEKISSTDEFRNSIIRILQEWP